MGVTAEPCNCNAIRFAERHVGRLYERAFAPLGLTVDQFAALAKLDRHGPTPIVELAERLVMDRATLAYVLKGLGARRLVAIARAERDARCRIAALTEAGATLFLAAKTRWVALNTEIDAALGERAPLLRQLLKEVEGLDVRLDRAAAREAEEPVAPAMP